VSAILVCPYYPAVTFATALYLAMTYLSTKWEILHFTGVPKDYGSELTRVLHWSYGLISLISIVTSGALYFGMINPLIGGNPVASDSRPLSKWMWVIAIPLGIAIGVTLSAVWFIPEFIAKWKKRADDSHGFIAVAVQSRSWIIVQSEWVQEQRKALLTNLAIDDMNTAIVTAVGTALEMKKLHYEVAYSPPPIACVDSDQWFADEDGGGEL
jgi:hypothetical protein